VSNDNTKAEHKPDQQRRVAEVTILFDPESRMFGFEVAGREPRDLYDSYTAESASGEASARATISPACWCVRVGRQADRD